MKLSCHKTIFIIKKSIFFHALILSAECFSSMKKHRLSILKHTLKHPHLNNPHKRLNSVKITADFIFHRIGFMYVHTCHA